jgi:hypothetical protein
MIFTTRVDTVMYIFQYITDSTVVSIQMNLKKKTVDCSSFRKTITGGAHTESYM